MVHFTLELLGGFRLTTAGTELRLPTRKAEALLAYLALPAGKPHARETLSALLWGERGDAQARHSLSQTLFSIRKVAADAGAPTAVVIDTRGVALDPVCVGVDADRFAQLAAAGTPAALSEAAILYRGDLLEGLCLREEAFEEWLANERRRLHELALSAYSGLLGHYAAAGRAEEAVQAALRLVALDPLQESVHRHVMRLYAAQGRPSSALKQYELCARTLRRELGIEPETETTALRDEIRQMRATRGGAGDHRSTGTALAASNSHLDVPQFVSQARATTPAAITAGRDANESRAGIAVTLRPSDALQAPVPRSPRAVRAYGREAEVRYLQGCLEKALKGTRQVVFVSGEAGLGKTTLVEAFLDTIGTNGTVARIAQGQCLEHRGPGEAYMPVLEALGRLCRAQSGGRELIALLAAQAPTWLAQMPGLLDAAASEALERRIRGATRDRMLREMAEAVEAMAAERPLVLVLEDLHWSDPSTVDLLARLARRSEPARLLMIGTYRPAELRASGHPLHAVVRELCPRGHCEDLPLGFLSQPAMDAYLAARFPGATFPPELARLVHQRTDGNPLFMAGLAEFLVAEGLLVARDDGGWSLWAGPEELIAVVPGSLRQLIEQQLERLDAEDQKVLEAGSVAGREFSAAVVAAAVARNEDDTEARCAALARQGWFLHARGTAEWPDSTIASRYGFIHDLYQEVLYDSIPAGRRARLHRLCGVRLEAGYGSRAGERAAELAMHFVRGRAFEPAVRHLQLAAEQAFQRSAHPEAVGHPQHRARGPASSAERRRTPALGAHASDQARRNPDRDRGVVERRRRARPPASARTMPADGGRAAGTVARALRPRQFVRVPR